MAVQDRGWSLVVPHHASGARQARQQLAAELAGVVPSALCSDVVAVAAELLGNAVKHAAPLPGNVIRIECQVAGGPTGPIVELRVSDGGSTLTPTERSASPDSVDGRGLTIVAALAGAWGVEREGLGQVVWARLRATPTT
jgi:anti-sigma regulatory factor (Ser/Thr protein kinase)